MAAVMATGTVMDGIELGRLFHIQGLAELLNRLRPRPGGLKAKIGDPVEPGVPQIGMGKIGVKQIGSSKIPRSAASPRQPGCDGGEPEKKSADAPVKSAPDRSVPTSLASMEDPAKGA